MPTTDADLIAAEASLLSSLQTSMRKIVMDVLRYRMEIATIQARQEATAMRHERVFRQLLELHNQGSE